MFEIVRDYYFSLDTIFVCFCNWLNPPCIQTLNVYNYFSLGLIFCGFCKLFNLEISTNILNFLFIGFQFS